MEPVVILLLLMRRVLTFPYRKMDGKYSLRRISHLFNYGHVYFYLVESVVNMNLQSDARTDDDEDFVDCMNTDTVTAKPLKK